MKRPKKKFLIKRRKNPYFDETYFDWLKSALLRGDPQSLAFALNYYRIGYVCNDCEDTYKGCTCEGDRELKDFEGYNEVCRYCKMNFCLCDYDIYEDDEIDSDKIRKIAYLQTINTLNIKDIEKIFSKLSLWLDKSENLFRLQESFFLKTFYKIFNLDESIDRRIKKINMILGKL